MLSRTLSLSEILRRYDKYNPINHSGFKDIQSQSAPYYLHELLKLKFFRADDIRDVHKAKLTYGAVRLVQDG
jgi:hypothetical protein